MGFCRYAGQHLHARKVNFYLFKYMGLRRCCGATSFVLDVTGSIRVGESEGHSPASQFCLTVEKHGTFI